MRRLFVLAALFALSSCATEPAPEPESTRPPNIVLVVADDLGYAELGSYGQTRIRTPNLDALAAEGMRFTDFYSGSPVCAPSRSVLLQGLHTGHAYIRDNDEMPERGDVWRDPSLEGQRPLPTGTFTMAGMLQEAGYRTAAIGKWGLGGPGSTGAPNRQGFDHFYGHLCQRVAHNYYPTHLWRNDEKDLLEGNEYFFPHQELPEDADPLDPASYRAYAGTTYAMDAMVEEALGFVRDHHDRPFFLYLPFPVPHVSLQVPEDSLAEYDGAFEDAPYRGDQGYTPHPTPRAAYAAMITRMDRDIGRLLALLDELGVGDDTLILFTSDNGPTFNGGTDSAFFESAGPLRGLKTELYEGGIRVPLIARWRGRIAPGTTSDLPSAFWDLLPTVAEVAEVEPAARTDGVSILPTLLGRAEEQERHEILYWEFQGGQALRLGSWKALRPAPGEPIALYDLATDIAETEDVAAENPEVVARIEALLTSSRTESDLFPLVREGR